MPGRILSRTSHYIQEPSLRESKIKINLIPQILQNTATLLISKHAVLLSWLNILISSANKIGIYDCIQQNWHIAYNSVLNILNLEAQLEKEM